MKKIVILYFVCMIGLFFLPALWIKQYQVERSEEQEVSEIRLLLSETGEVVTMSLEEYIMGVLVGEMPVSFEMEALKAQAVVARTYTLYKMKNAARFS